MILGTAAAWPRAGERVIGESPRGRVLGVRLVDLFEMLPGAEPFQGDNGPTVGVVLVKEPEWGPARAMASTGLRSCCGGV